MSNDHLNSILLSSQSQPRDWQKFYDSEFQEHQRVAQLTHEKLFDAFYAMSQICLKALKQGRKIMFFGNGGSAADAQHLATELTVRFMKNRSAIRAISLTTDTSALTAIGNDLGFESLFSRQIEAVGQAGDVVVAISTSGQSPNIIKALETARHMNIARVAFGGKDGGKMVDLADCILVVPSYTTARIQEMHITLGQMLCSCLEQALDLVQ